MMECNPIGSTLSVEYFLEEELKNSRGAYNRWGRQVIQAIEVDDCLRMQDAFHKYLTLGANINTKVDQYGYGGYSWTVWIHKFAGDTALHICLKLKKIRCICLLLLMPNIDLGIANNDSETVDDLCKQHFDQSIYDYQKVARSLLYRLLDPRDFHRIPYENQFFQIEEEAWNIMKSGRCLYSEVPASIVREFDWDERPSLWTFGYTPYKGPFMKHRDTGQMRKLNTREQHWLNSMWREKRESSGWKYFENKLTGQVLEELTDEILVCIDNSYEDNEEERMNKVYGALERQHVNLLGAQREAIISSAKPNKFIAISPLATHIPGIESVRGGGVYYYPVDIKASSAVQATDNASATAVDQLKTAADNFSDLTAKPIGNAIVIQHSRNELPRMTEKEFLHEFYYGVSTTPGAQATNNVWGRGTIGDIVRLVQRQKLRQQQKQLQEIKKNSGLGLLQSSGDLSFFAQESGDEAVHTASRPQHELFGAHQQARQQQLEQAQKAQRILRAINDSQGISKLRFVKMKQLKKLARQHFAIESAEPDKAAISEKKIVSPKDSPDENSSDNLASSGKGPSKAITSKSAKGASSKSVKSEKNTSSKDDISGKVIESKSGAYHLEDYDALESDAMEELEDSQEEALLFADEEYLKDKKQPIDDLDLPDRPITMLSTKSNLKYLHVGNRGISVLSIVLSGDTQISHLCLSNARISCAGAIELAKNMEQIRNLTYLDLSQNGISDAGAEAIAASIASAAIPKQQTGTDALLAEGTYWPKHPLKQLILSGNRISMTGATALVTALLESDTLLRSIRLCRNPITPANCTAIKMRVQKYNSGAVTRYEEAVAAAKFAEAQEQERERHRLHLLALAKANSESSKLSQKRSLPSRIAATSARLVTAVAKAISSSALPITNSSKKGDSDMAASASYKASGVFGGPWFSARSNRPAPPSDLAARHDGNPSAAALPPNTSDTRKVYFDFPEEHSVDAELFNGMGTASTDRDIDFGAKEEREVSAEYITKYKLKYVYV